MPGQPDLVERARSILRPRKPLPLIGTVANADNVQTTLQRAMQSGVGQRAVLEQISNSAAIEHRTERRSPLNMIPIGLQARTSEVSSIPTKPYPFEDEVFKWLARRRTIMQRSGESNIPSNG